MITGSKLIFCRDYNLILYSKKVLLTDKLTEKPEPRAVKVKTNNDLDSKSDSDIDKKDALSDINKDA